MKIVLYDDKGVEIDDIDMPDFLAAEAMAEARKILHSRRY